MPYGPDDRFRFIPDMRPEAVVSSLGETVDYCHRIMNVSRKWKETRGSGAVVAILDSGVPNHRDIGVSGWKTFFNTGYSEDMCGHATHVGGIVSAIAGNGTGVRGIAPDADDWYGVVLDRSGSGSIRNIVSGIYWAVDEVGADIVNMSLGIPGGSRIDRSFEKACDYAYDNGVTLVAAAGNDASTVNYPARFDSVLAVGAVDSRLRPADFTSHGSEVEFAAGGVGVYSTYLENSYCRLSGTSMAAPMVSGVLCLMAAAAKSEGRSFGPDDARRELRSICMDIGEAGKDDYTGYGIPVFSNEGGNSTQARKQGLWPRILGFLGRIFSV